MREKEISRTFVINWVTQGKVIQAKNARSLFFVPSTRTHLQPEDEVVAVSHFYLLIILKWILERYDEMVRAGLNWLRIGNNAVMNLRVQ